MGHTHYWNSGPITPKALAAIARDCEVVCDASGILLAGPHGTGDAQIDDHAIWFNGEKPEHHEAFYIGKGGFNYCKTAQKPYDLCVQACLIVLAHHTNAEVTSDGTEAEWDEAREHCQDCLGYGAEFRLANRRDDTPSPKAAATATKASPSSGTKKPPTLSRKEAAIQDELAWAREALDLDTLEDRNRDSLDFHSIPVSAIRILIRHAFVAGYDAAKAAR